MKKRITSCHTRLLCAVLAACLLFAGCTAAPAAGTDPGMPAPSILLNGQAYYAPHMPVYELPEGYEYVGTLSQEADNGTGLAGSKMYMDPSQDPVTDFYLYQETGTPIGANTVDTTHRQWMYVRWSLPND